MSESLQGYAQNLTSVLVSKNLVGRQRWQQVLNPLNENKQYKHKRTGGYNNNSKKVLQYSHDRYRRPCHFFGSPAPNFPSYIWRNPPSHVQHGRDRALTSHMEAKHLDLQCNNPPAATRLKFGQSDVLALLFPSRAVGTFGMALSSCSAVRKQWCRRQKALVVLSRGDCSC